MIKVFGLYKERTEEEYGFSSKMSSGEVGKLYALVFRTQFSSLTAEEKSFPTRAASGGLQGTSLTPIPENNSVPLLLHVEAASTLSSSD